MRKTFALAALFSAALAAPALAEDEPTGPSFDCAKASTPGEKIVCDTPDLGWSDRQLAKSYAVAQKAIGEAGAAALKSGQQAFLKKRDACTGDDPYSCVSQAYAARIEELVALVKSPDFTAGNYGTEGGGVSLVRYPDKLAGVQISTIGGGDHTCSFETDKAKVGAGGALSYEAKYEGMDETCKIDIAMKGDRVTVTSTAGCSYWCGARAELDGTFKKISP